MAVDTEVLDWLRDAVAIADSWESVNTALRSHDPEGSDERLRPFLFAFGYAFHAEGTAARDSAGGPFGASVAGDGWRFPPAVADVDSDDVAAWREALESVNHHVAQARLGDLLWERKQRPDPHLAARSACDGLLLVADDEAWRGMDRVRCLARALELARVTRDAGRQATVIERMLDFAEEDLASSVWSPGLALGVLRPLAWLPSNERPGRLSQLLERTGERYGSDPHIFDAVANLQSKLVDDARRLDVRRAQVMRWRDEATKGDTMLRVLRLEQALEIARNYGLKDEANDLRRELGGITADELGLETISAEVEIPADEVEPFLQSFAEAKTWQDALRSMAIQGPPGGSPAELEAHVDELMAAFPVQFLFTKSIIGPDNATAAFRAATPEAHRRLALAEQRAQQARIWGTFCASALQRIGAREDRPSREDLADFLTSDFIEPEVAERIARAIELFWEEQFDESAHVIVPRLERVLREMARQVGIPIVREPRPDKEIGGVEMLGGLLRDLKGAFADAGWHAYLLNLLADPLGLNLRNRISHGLHGTVGAIDASLLAQAALLFAGMSLQPAEEPQAAPPDASSTDETSG
jgi:hypothetical protein